MTKAAAFTQADVARMVRGALKAGLPVGSFMVSVDNRGMHLLPARAAEDSDAADLERRMEEAFGEDGDRALALRR